MNAYISTGLFLQQTNGGAATTQSQASSISNVPAAELRRRKAAGRPKLFGGSTMASSNSNDQRVKLERVIGMTVSSVAALACDSVNGLIAYTAGCTVVLYSSKRNRQAHIINPARKNITCVAFSSDGNYLAIAECGHQPSVQVWDIEERSQIVELQGGHTFGVSCLMFSPDTKYLISVGNQHDNVVNVWNWRNQRKSSTNKVSCKVKAISFAEDGSYFVTVGVRHVKFWYLERKNTSTPKYQDTVPLQGRSAILADQRNNYFCDVACGRGAVASKTFAITQSGLLCEFNNKRLLEKWLDLKTRCAYSLSLSEEHIFIGCAEGIVHVFKAGGLSYVATLPRPHFLGIDIASPLSTTSKFSKYPDVIATRYDENRRRLTCIYNDHSLYQWEIGEDFKQLGKAYSMLSHGGCIWSIETYPSSAQFLPPGTFFTGSSDDTIRIWNIDPNMPIDTTAIRKNIYSQELLKVIYSDSQFAHLCDTEMAVEKQENQYDGKSGIRALKTSSDGRHLATGDRSGNLRVYSMTDFSLLHQLSAHDSEVLCLEYSSPQTGSYFLASSSRDRLLHVLDPTRNYEPVCTIDDHSSSITSVKFVRGIFNSIRSTKQDANEQITGGSDDLVMLSGGADKSIIIRKMVPDTNGQQQFVRANYIALQSTVYDMDVDKARGTVLAACQDRQIRTYHVADGKFERSFKGSSADDNSGTLIKLELDPSCTFVATSTNDKQTYIIDATTGDFVASMIGHGELVTGLKFSNDYRHLITVSGDGCIFVWRLSSELTNRMLVKQAKAGKSESCEQFDAKSNDSTTSDFVDTTDIHVSCSDMDENTKDNLANKKPMSLFGEVAENQNVPRPRGRWSTSINKRPEPDGLESTESSSSTRAACAPHLAPQNDYVAPAGSVQKILRQFEKEKSETTGNVSKKTHGDGDFGSLMNVRLIGVDEEDNGSHSRKEEVVYLPPAAGNADVNLGRDFVVKERSNTVSKAYRGADTLDVSDEESAAASSAETGSIRTSESIGELHPRQHRMVVDAFEKLESPESRFDRDYQDRLMERGTPERQSITSRYLGRGGIGTANIGETGAPAPAAASRSRWNLNRPPVVPARILITPTSTPSPNTGASTSAKHDTPLDSPSLLDNSTVLRAKQLSSAAQRIQNRDRRQTMASFDQEPQATGSRHLADQSSLMDYASSELHQRSRSRSRGAESPSRQQITSSRSHNRFEGDNPEDENRKTEKPSTGFRSKLITSRSMTSLILQSTTHDSASASKIQNAGAALKRLTDIREKLRKSQENIAFGANASGRTTPVAEPTSPFSDWNESAVSSTRSKSFGNLASASTMADADNAPRKQSTPIAADGTGRSRLSSLLQSRGIALSVGSLRDRTAESCDETSQANPSDSSTAVPPTNLVGAILDFKKRSITDLSQGTLTTEDRSDSVMGSFYGKVSTMPRRYHHATNSSVGKKAQAIRSQRLTAGSTTDRVSVSGESEDSSTDFYNVPRPNVVGTPLSVTRSQIITPSMRQRLDVVGDNASSRSSSPGVGLQQQQQKAYDVARQIMEAKQRQGQYGTPAGFTAKGIRPSASSYLAKILNSGDDLNQMDSHSGNASNTSYFSQGGRHQSEASAISGKRLSNQLVFNQGQHSTRDQLSAIVDSCDNYFDKMSGHCKDSVVQFRTSLDKVLQAYNMVVDDTDLTEAERDDLLRMLSVELEAARERLVNVLTNQRSPSASGRYEPEGNKDAGATVSSNRRYQPVHSPVHHPVAAAAVSPSGNDSQRDASHLLQEYSDMLVTLIQQKMSSQAGK